jgi:hypothetical protein
MLGKKATYDSLFCLLEAIWIRNYPKYLIFLAIF